MTKKIKVQANAELQELMETIRFIPEPVKKRELGEKVVLGKGKKAVIQGVLESGKILWIRFENTVNPRTKYVNWMDLVEETEEETNFVENRDLQIHYSQRMMGDIFHKAYHFGIDFNPSYQRGDVWEKEDKELLIESIFKNVDIGKITFVAVSEKEYAAVEGKFMFEILDGKQRVRAVLDFVEGRFTYRGKTYAELSERDRMHIKRYSISVAELKNLTLEDKYRFFLKLNTTGKTIDKKHLEKTEETLQKMMTEG